MDPAEMTPHFNKSLTLMELVIAIVLVSIVVLVLSSIYLFSHYQVFSANRRAEAQNEASLVLEHMAKNLVQAIGSPAQDPITLQQNPPAPNPNPNSRIIRVWIDDNGNGSRDPAGPGGDIESQYRWDRASSTVRYWRNRLVGAGEVISGNITNCVWAVNWATLGNNIRVDISACAELSFPCGTPDNPNVDITTTIKMPSVSAN